MTKIIPSTGFKINRVLPPHELNARRARKRVVTPFPKTAVLAPNYKTGPDPEPSAPKR
jgi:hypothetical protein